MNIQQAAAQTGLSADTIRYYERRGVLPPAPRATNGYRVYLEEHIETLRLAKRLRDLGIPLERVALVIGVWHEGTCGDLRDNLVATLNDVLRELDAQLANLQETRAQVASLRAGLESMPVADAAIPGREPCPCIVMVERTGTH